MHRPGADGDTREAAIERHLPLVETIARRLAGRGEPLDDLIQAGSIGLIKAVDRFDPERGNKLESYAAPAIEGEIRHHLRRRRRDQRRETADSLEAVAGGADAGDETHVRLLVEQGWQRLSEPEQQLLQLRYFDDLTQTEIARRLGISQAQVSRRLRTTLGRLESELDTDVAASTDPAYSRDGMAGPARESEPERRHSGRLLVRMPQALHTELAQAAEREGVSLNAFVTGALADAVGRPDEDAPAARPGDAAPQTTKPAEERSWLSVALVANFAIVAVAAILAIVLLVVAWQGG
jgi:RNA polymerase sigma-B factor